MRTKNAPRFTQLMAVQDDVVDDWSNRVRTEIPYAYSLSFAVLTDALPALYEELAAAVVTGPGPFHRFQIAAAHGSQRARATRFNAGAIAREFRILRSAIAEAWQSILPPAAHEETQRLNEAVDIALEEALTGFSLAESKIREQFFSALTHDLRTPLATAATAVNLIHKTEDLARAHRLAKMAMRQHLVLEAMTVDLLDMMVENAGPAATDWTDTDMLDLVSDVVDGIALSSGRAIRMAGEPVQVTCHVAAVRRALENMLNNAIKYSDKGTPVDVSLGAGEKAISVAVTNTGPTIPRDQVEAIFQLFRRAPHDQCRGITGWGIGLPYVRSVAEQHGGSVHVESNDSVTTFLFTVLRNSPACR